MSEPPPPDRRLRLIQSGSEEQNQAILAALDDPTIRILVPAEPDVSDQLLALALVDLLGRLFPRIEVPCPSDIAADPRLPPGAPSLAERLEEARAHGCAALPTGEASFTIALGRTDTGADLYADGHGWHSYLGSTPSRLPHDADETIPVGALVGACRAAAHTFTQLLEGFVAAREIPTGEYFSALSYRTETGPFSEAVPELGGRLDAVLVGAGSIGGALVYLLARCPGLTGALAIVDPQSLDEHNLDRAILATAADTRAKSAKATVAAEALAHLPGLDVDPREERISQFLASRGREEMLPLLCSAVDTFDSRREIQDCLPLELINAACNPAEVMISGHRTDDGPCVCCLHMAQVLDAEQIRARLIARDTRVPFGQVVAWMNQRVQLPSQALRGIEINTHRSAGSLEPYAGRTIEELWSEQFMYGATKVGTDGGAVAQVAAPWVTALGGFLLAGEALKAAAGGAYDAYRLGPRAGAPGLRYVEAVYVSPRHAQLTVPARWEGSQCLCNSPRRLRLLRERYGLSVR
jgi:ThiF family protein